MSGLIRVLLAFVTCVTLPYVLGTVLVAYLTAQVLSGRPHRPGKLGRSVRRTAIHVAVVVLWPLCLVVLGRRRWRDRLCCPFDECSRWGWGTAGAVRVQALISVHQCPHQRPTEAELIACVAGYEQDREASWCAWVSSLPAALMATTLGALASLPVAGSGFLVVYAAVTITTVFPLQVLSEELLGRIAQRPITCE
jgi:hypothetical protein